MTLQPVTTFVDGLHRYAYMAQELEVVLDRFAEDKREGLVAEIRITTSRQPTPGLLHAARLRLMNPRSRADVVVALTRRTDGPADFFTTVLEQVCYKSIDRWRRGEPTIALADVDPQEAPRQIHDLLTDGSTIMFADGGAGKSLIAASLAVNVASGVPILGRLLRPPCAVMYLDWEADHYITAERVQAVCRGAGIEEQPAIYYRRQVASLAEAAVDLKREITAHNVGFAIVDSLGPARGSGEGTFAPDATFSMFRAARSLGVPWLGIDHVPKNAKDPSRPYGSTYTHNLARLAWAVERAQDEGENEITVALVNHKNNYGRMLRRRAFRIRFDNGEGDHLHSVEFESVDMRDVPGLAAKLPLKERILAGLRGGKQTTAALAAALDAPESQVRARLAELAKSDRVHRLGAEWGLAG